MYTTSIATSSHLTLPIHYSPISNCSIAYVTMRTTNRSPPPVALLTSPPRALKSFPTLHYRNLLTYNRPASTTSISIQRGLRPSLHRMTVRAFGLDSESFSDMGNGVESPSEVARQFYTRINGKDENGLSRVIAKDCELEDCAFHKPFQGAKAVENLLRDLMLAMGDNVKFSIEKSLEGSIEKSLEGSGSAAAIVWHLGMNLKEIPIFFVGVS